VSQRTETHRQTVAVDSPGDLETKGRKGLKVRLAQGETGVAEAVQSLWIGPSLGLMERLAITSFLRHGHEFHLYCYEEIANVPEGTVVRDGSEVLPASSIFCYDQGPGAGSVSAFSNLFRYKLLLERGGWWVDMDMVCLKPFDFPEPVVFCGQHTPDSWQVNTSVIRLPPGHDVAQFCYDAAVQRGREGLVWGETGPMLLHLAVLAHGLNSLVQGAGIFMPLPYWGWRLVLCEDASQCLAFLEKSDCFAVHLFHEQWRRAGIDRQTEFPATCYFSHLLQQYGIDLPGR
jgi:hypothetical protein